jgi:hypothetical protein
VGLSKAGMCWSVGDYSTLNVAHNRVHMSSPDLGCLSSAPVPLTPLFLPLPPPLAKFHQAQYINLIRSFLSTELHFFRRVSSREGVQNGIDCHFLSLLQQPFSISIPAASTHSKKKHCSRNAKVKDSSLL